MIMLLGASGSAKFISANTVCPKKHSYSFIVFCFVGLYYQSFTASYDVFIHVIQGCLTGTRGEWLPIAWEVTLKDMGKINHY